MKERPATAAGGASIMGTSGHLGEERSGSRGATPRVEAAEGPSQRGPIDPGPGSEKKYPPANVTRHLAPSGAGWHQLRHTMNARARCAGSRTTTGQLGGLGCSGLNAGRTEYWATGSARPDESMSLTWGRPETVQGLEDRLVRASGPASAPVAPWSLREAARLEERQEPTSGGRVGPGDGSGVAAIHGTGEVDTSGTRFSGGWPGAVAAKRRGCRLEAGVGPLEQATATRPNARPRSVLGRILGPPSLPSCPSSCFRPLQGRSGGPFRFQQRHHDFRSEEPREPHRRPSCCAGSGRAKRTRDPVAARAARGPFPPARRGGWPSRLPADRRPGAR